MLCVNDICPTLNVYLRLVSNFTMRNPKYCSSHFFFIICSHYENIDKCNRISVVCIQYISFTIHNATILKKYCVVFFYKKKFAEGFILFSMIFTNIMTYKVLITIQKHLNKAYLMKTICYCQAHEKISKSIIIGPLHISTTTTTTHSHNGLSLRLGGYVTMRVTKIFIFAIL